MRILEHARVLLRQVENLKSAASETELPAGPLRLGATPSTLAGLVPSILKDWVTIYPNIGIHIGPASSRLLRERVERGELDGAIVVHPQFTLPKTLAWHTLRVEPLILLAPEALEVTELHWYPPPASRSSVTTVIRLAASSRNAISTRNRYRCACALSSTASRRLRDWSRRGWACRCCRTGANRRRMYPCQTMAIAAAVSAAQYRGGLAAFQRSIAIGRSIRKCCELRRSGAHGSNHLTVIV